MKGFNLFLRFIIVFFVFYFMLKLGFRFLYWIFSAWYVSIPLIILLYLLLFNPLKKVSPKNKQSDLDPSKEIKLDQEPEIKDDEPTNDNGGNEE